MRRLEATLPLILLRLQMTFSLQAYDCTSPETKYAEVSLKEVGPCSQVGKNYENPKPTEMQVMRKIKSNNFKSKWCRVKVDIETYVCGHDGWYSYTYPGKKITTNEVIEISKEECEGAHRTGKLAIDIGSANIIVIPFSHTYYASNTIEVKGDTEKDTSCEGEDFKFRGGKYENSILQVKYTAEIQKVHAIYTADDRTVTIPNKVQAEADALIAKDVVYGTFTWDKEDLTREMRCENYQEIISGNALLYNPTNNNTEYEPIVLFEDSRQGRHAALMVGTATGACGRIVYTTQLEDIFLVMLTDKKERLNIKGINSMNADRFLNLEGLISLTHLSSELRLNEAFSKITGSICEANKLRLEESINNFAANGVGLSNKPEGTITIKAGSTAYLFNCAPTEVELRFDDHNACTHEIPVWVQAPEGRIAKFTDPVSLVILSNATLTICSSISPIKWALPSPSGNGFDWFCSTPVITKCTAPTILDPMLIKKSVFDVKTQHLSLTFFDRKHLQNLARFQSMKNVRDAISTKLTHDVLNDRDHSSPGYNILKRIPIKELEKIKNELTPWLTQVLGTIWEYLGHFIIAYFMCKIITRIVLLLTRIRRMIEIHGCSPKICYAFFTELFLAAINANSHTCCPCKDLSLEDLKSMKSESKEVEEHSDTDW